MAENYNNNEQVPVTAAPETSVETTDRGIFDFIKKDDQKPAPIDNLATEFDNKVQVSEPVEEKKHDSLLHKFHQADDHAANSSSCSSSDEEDDEDKKRRKKEKKEKKGVKAKIIEKLPGHEDTNVPIEKPHVEEVVYSEPSNPEDVEKKGFLDMVKDKLTGEKKVVDEHHHDTVAAPVVVEPSVEPEVEVKKGFVEKIKEKIHGFGAKDGEEKKEHK